MVRELLNMDTGELQHESGYNQCTIRQMETGRLSVSDDYLKRLVAAVDVREDWLKNDDGGEPTVERIFKEYYEVDGKLYPRKALIPKQQSKRVREVFEKSGLTQRDFCKETGWTLSNFQDILNGRRKLSVRYAERLEKRFEISIDWLLYGIEEAYPLTGDLVKWIKENKSVRKKLWDEYHKSGRKMKKAA